MNQNNISGVVLAAGASKRMVENKILLPFKGKTIIEYIVECLLRTRLSEIIIVGGRDFEQLSALMKPLPVKCIENVNYLEGQSTSMKLGLNQISPTSSGCFFFMGDQPLIQFEAINQMISQFDQADNPSTIVMPIGLDGRGAPVLFGKGLFDALNEINGDQGGRSVIQNSDANKLEYYIDDPSFFWDIDTLEAYQKVLGYADTI